MQWEYLECAKQYFEQVESDPITDQIMARWEYVLTCLETDPMQLDRELDWVIKKKLIETYVESRQLKWNSAKVMMLDLQYHNIRPDFGLYYKLEKDGRVERIVSDDEVEHAMHHPPETTRAKVPRAFCKAGKRAKDSLWSGLELYPAVRTLPKTLPFHRSLASRI